MERMCLGFMKCRRRSKHTIIAGNIGIDSSMSHSVERLPCNSLLASSLVDLWSPLKNSTWNPYATHKGEGLNIQ